jgi:hypothetical protein
MTMRSTDGHVAEHRDAGDVLRRPGQAVVEDPEHVDVALGERVAHDLLGVAGGPDDDDVRRQAALTTPVPHDRPPPGVERDEDTGDGQRPRHEHVRRRGVAAHQPGEHGADGGADGDGTEHRQQVDDEALAPPEAVGAEGAQQATGDEGGDHDGQGPAHRELEDRLLSHRAQDEDRGDGHGDDIREPEPVGGLAAALAVTERDEAGGAERSAAVGTGGRGGLRLERRWRRRASGHGRRCSLRRPPFQRPTVRPPPTRAVLPSSPRRGTRSPCARGSPGWPKVTTASE